MRHKFDLPWEDLAEGYEGSIQGSIRASPQEGYSALDREMGSYAPHSNNTFTGNGSAMSRSRSWLLQKNNEISVTDSFSTTLPSVDLSLDFFGDIPNEFWPLITFVEVYTSILKQHEDKVLLQDSAIRFLGELDPETTDFEVPIERQIPLGECGAGFVEVFLEFGLLLDTTVSHGASEYSRWSVDNRLCDLPALQEAIEIILQATMSD